MNKNLLVGIIAGLLFGASIALWVAPTLFKSNICNKPTLVNNFVVFYDGARNEIIREQVQELRDIKYIARKLDSLYNAGDGDTYYVGMLQDGVYVEQKLQRIQLKKKNDRPRYYNQ